jgi:hypothetical protein
LRALIADEMAATHSRLPPQKYSQTRITVGFGLIYRTHPSRRGWRHGKLELKCRGNSRVRKQKGKGAMLSIEQAIRFARR